MLVGPSGLRSALQLAALMHTETEAASRLQDERVQARLRQLQPAWTESVLPQARTIGKDLQRLVTNFNDLSALVIAFDAQLRATDVMDLPKARKTSLPPSVRPPRTEAEERGEGQAHVAMWREERAGTTSVTLDQ